MGMYKYFIRYNYEHDQNKTIYITARSKQEALIKLLKRYKVNAISRLEIEGDPLPTCSGESTLTVKQQLLKKEQTKAKQRKARLDFYNKYGYSVFDKK